MRPAWRHRVSSGNQFCYCDSTSTRTPRQAGTVPVTNRKARVVPVETLQHEAALAPAPHRRRRRRAGRSGTWGCASSCVGRGAISVPGSYCGPPVDKQWNTSRGRSRRWCSMSTSGNRAKKEAIRSRSGQ
ncbi:CGNR zinc finger domain-containing protein [Streptomyces sp. DSM 40750]|uniref:CGNR zinc finger domain-containing protein n=1 Tax=Streptomyces sp. DSM 40750 TaxID=2801030 RepID=UPI00214CD84D|nr:CGNR zinc finger domain-containing protein [Streptomyces sp. DSM 40750]UUU19674.1 CGNR zinc finger domain-containing protein [Streptomyces sp. DSM 40750]UUU26985.1 CGNR zinc finger domain-containing protein [Streptomyces sp. DSM 40750]